ncbi:MAG: hypothetical protein A4E37_01893 [Methanoregulaceae archaeon PtaB.Bin056]|nr:MAG: hypothetical protein A4E37_01893 [Methanoregulaceae archaeon PtaB.Bin056]
MRVIIPDFCPVLRVQGVDEVVIAPHIHYAVNHRGAGGDRTVRVIIPNELAYWLGTGVTVYPCMSLVRPEHPSLAGRTRSDNEHRKHEYHAECQTRCRKRPFPYSPVNYPGVPVRNSGITLSIYQIHVFTTFVQGILAGGKSLENPGMVRYSDGYNKSCENHGN